MSKIKLRFDCQSSQYEFDSFVHCSFWQRLLVAQVDARAQCFFCITFVLESQKYARQTLVQMFRLEVCQVQSDFKMFKTPRLDISNSFITYLLLLFI